MAVRSKGVDILLVCLLELSLRLLGLLLVHLVLARQGLDLLAMDRVL